MSNKIVKGFSKLSKEAKIEWITNEYLNGDDQYIKFLKSYWHNEPKIQKVHDEFIENTISNFYIPFGVAPNFLINGEVYCIPMAIEESSVVAAASKNASFWMERGGFKSKVVSTTKIGHVHFAWYGNFQVLKSFINSIKHKFFEESKEVTKNMEERGGGILDIEVINRSDLEPNYYQLQAKFETCDAMGANFINSLLEKFSKILERELLQSDLTKKEKKIVIIMCILSNYTPECIVRCEVNCSVDDLSDDSSVNSLEFAKKFQQAIHVANIEPYRATTHNKGIFNGIDAVVIATGNDFRAVEACGHTYASKSGQYKSLTNVEIKDGEFKFWIDLPIAVGTVGGLTSLHPMVKFSHQLLGNPNAEKLMEIIAAAGLAQNFGALRSLVTTGIQKGHMKMHLLNILNQLGANKEEIEKIKEYFKDKVVEHSAVVNFFNKIRGINKEKFINKEN
ncbi:MAG: hydroxymethylglutaryl-CoA reductase, degradative [Crocinitomicaceae bacterium TMED135]|nr:MAG: hydroxymethylglutaryl-CoA reductase, degradative [Crocinitomicaceae bacterium TMED135]